MKPITYLAVHLIIAATMSACTTPVPIAKVPMDVPAGFKEADQWKAARKDAATVPDDWWTLFNDFTLNDLQQRLLEGNQSLRASAAQVEVARAAVGGARSAGSPIVSVTAGSTNSVPPGEITATTANSVAANASWELDLWGRVAGSISSAEARFQATSADLLAARWSIHALLTQTYFSLRSTEAQALLLERSVTAYQRSLELTQNRYTGGIASAADVAQATTQLRSTQAQLIELQSSRAQLEHALATLLGEPGANFSLARTGVLPAAPQVPIQLPSDLMQRRPDIAAASARVAAANSQIGVAQSAFFPAITLSASAGFRNANVFNLLSAPSLFWSLGPALASTIFDGGARKTNEDSARASATQATATYRQTVLSALQEVEDNLVSTASLEEQAALQNDALNAAQRNLEITNNQYKAGIVSYLNVVTAQTIALSSERALLDVRSRRLAAIAVLLKNLGGRWTSAPADWATVKSSG